MNHAQWGESIGRSWGFPTDIVDAMAEHHLGADHGLSWVVSHARDLSVALGIGDGILPASPPDADSEALLPVIEEMGGDTAVLERIDWYGGAFKAA